MMNDEPPIKCRKLTYDPSRPPAIKKTVPFHAMVQEMKQELDEEWCRRFWGLDEESDTTGDAGK